MEPGRFYDYAAWVKADLLSGEAYLRITFWSRQGAPSVWRYEGEARTNAVTDTQGAWIQATGSVQAPASAEFARVEATLSDAGVGSVWFDDAFFGLATCLDISKRDDPDPVALGGVLTYTIVYSNTGREKATDVEIVDTYDPYVHFEWAQPPPDMSANIWRIPELLPGASGTITVVVQVADDTGEHSSLVNCVQIRSDETVNPIYICITTTIIGPGVCHITLRLPNADKPGEPGKSVCYDLTMCYTRDCDGQLNLVTSSSQGWDVTIAPSPPYTLPSGSCIAMTVSLLVPQQMTCDTVDVTVITATLACEPPCNASATSTATVTTSVTCPVFLPLVMKDPRDCFAGPWEREPNDSCEEANGPLCSCREYYGYHNDNWDCFSVALHTAGQITVDLTTELIEGVQLQLRDQGYGIVDYIYIPPYHIEYSGSAGPYYICIYTAPGHINDRPYTLHATFP